MRKSKGFTLIELLVVIAIIGILAAIVLVSLSSARSKAYDAAIQSDLNQIRSAAEIYNNTNNGYTSTATGVPATVLLDPGVVKLLGDITTNQHGTGVTDYAGAAAYCAYATLSTGKIWCVDSSLNSVSLASAPTNCTSNANCATTADTCKCQ